MHIEPTDDILDGTPVFTGSRVPVQTLLDYLRAGDRLAAFLADFPTVRHKNTLAVFELAGEALLSRPFWFIP